MAVPDAFFKVVLRAEGMPEAIGFIFGNASVPQPLGDSALSVDGVERIAGAGFSCLSPGSIEKKRSPDAICPIDFGMTCNGLIALVLQSLPKTGFHLSDNRPAIV